MVRAMVVIPGGSDPWRTSLTSGSSEPPLRLALARAIPPSLACTVITHSPTVAAALVEHPAAEVLILGGKLATPHVDGIGGGGSSGIGGGCGAPNAASAADMAP